MRNRSLFCLLIFLLITPSLSSSEDMYQRTSWYLRIRAGDNGMGRTNTVRFTVPGLELANSTPVISTNPISGGSGSYTVRFVMDTRSYDPPSSHTGRFTVDSSQPLDCATPATCGTAFIPFNHIGWTVRDGDCFGDSSFTANTGQQIHSQTTPPPSASSRSSTRRMRNYFQYAYDNTLFLPSGTYRGTAHFEATYP